MHDLISQRAIFGLVNRYDYQQTALAALAGATLVLLAFTLIIHFLFPTYRSWAAVQTPKRLLYRWTSRLAAVSFLVAHAIQGLLYLDKICLANGGVLWIDRFPSTVLGRGDAVFESGKSAIRAWGPFRLPWIRTFPQAKPG